MTQEMKDNLSQVFRQHDLRLNLDQSNEDHPSGQAPALKAFSLQATSSPFVVSNPYALQLDEII
ncbi:hypothetical protein [Polynucleobacter sp. CS-Odin-A6]|uniref:hypothetical protein n=1 Tax=Polynucleobacter sp. CS-Odin-A6 TaxID=2689106 RepID=UPI001C0ABEEE|nr:hypothetical protein [Polynucleobacter sp. CS-Odin-A6]MBU3622032.1 hypothetical protein [Polynucleobacter sp. CS-Odin-A6]